MLNPFKKLDLSRYMIEKAENEVETAKMLLYANRYEPSISRSYYAIFWSMRSVLALDLIEFKKHSAVISYFTKEYLKTNIMDKKFSNTIRNAFMYRSKSDYDYFYLAFKSDAEEQYQNAKEFLEAVKIYLKERTKDEKTIH